MRTLIKYTLFLTKIHGFAFIFSFLFLGATPQVSKVFAQDKVGGIQVNRAPSEPVAIEGEYIVQFKSDKPLKNIENGQNPSWVSKLGKDVKIDTSLSEFKIAHIRVANPASTGQWENLANILSSNPSIQHVEPNYIVYSHEMPNDPSIKDMWFLKNISALKAWDVSQEGEEVVVAVVDTGMQIDHEDLKGRILRNENEIHDNGKDDDHNGFTDDIYGWNFSDGNNFSYSHLYAKPTVVKDKQNQYKCMPHPTEKKYEFHGTHVAGTIAATANNAKGIIGISPHVKIMPIKVLGGTCGSGTHMSVLMGVYYAAANGARIINMSLGGPSSSKIAYELYKSLSNKGILIVASAGNETSDNDGSTPSYPASYPLDGIISVAATGPDDELARFSNWGRTSVDIAAPGTSILSTIPDGTDDNPFSSYYSTGGTSMAAPIVSGAAALLLSQNPSLTNIQLKKILMASTDKIPALNGKIVSGGRLNLYKALTYKGNITTVAKTPAHDAPSRASISQTNSIGGIRVYDQRGEKQKW